MDNVDSTLKSVLDSLGYPVERLIMQKKQKPDTYFTYQLVLCQPVQHADDENGAEEYIYRVDLYAKTDYIALLTSLKQALKAAEFYGTTVDPEMYEQDTGYYHIPVQTKFIQEV